MNDLLETLKKLADEALAKDPKDRTYKDRYYIWEYEQYKNPIKTLDNYSEGEEVEIYDGTALAENRIKDGFGTDFPEWFRNWGKFFGRQVRVKATNKVKTLIGMSYTYRDYYYILEDNGRKSFETCVGGIDLILGY